MTLKLKLLKAHRHDGIDYSPGQTLTLDPEDAGHRFIADSLTQAPAGKTPVAERMPEESAAAPVPGAGSKVPGQKTTPAPLQG